MKEKFQSGIENHPRLADVRQALVGITKRNRNKGVILVDLAPKSEFDLKNAVRNHNATMTKQRSLLPEVIISI
jgi:phage terminase large subunit-like protein